MTLFKYIRESCYDTALAKLKEHQMAESFCSSFVHHIIGHDTLELHRYYREAGMSLLPLGNALEDLISWKLKANEERPHQLVDLFFEYLDTRTKEHNRATKPKDEL
ncbi:hypothetical protein SAMD00019534_094730 [Acytostelium subglobosum LB1]|uniref:hypothetical protein n=1 Tax=Acytostelium subglobosum LB1 TaxID=1410327 RepID=UPI0006447EC2|nr:hypothetical protein SAMD00019534_094730 [Acytostelium subglobosum LB1]GAM26298.1 hypothetical protein SAMD00019534_094730 [Acytostelium subglobosum LB1]|eukprot:XP_012750852.1 hypothetical protein SAMD00019534_094730 [Acytostelium subglobosum LB1]